MTDLELLRTIEQSGGMVPFGRSGTASEAEANTFDAGYDHAMRLVGKGYLRVTNVKRSPTGVGRYFAYVATITEAGQEFIRAQGQSSGPTGGR